MLYTKSLKTLVLAFKTEGERAILKAGLQYFVKEAQLYYERLSEYDPFKTEAMMIFLGADEDGGSLLDVEEI